MCRIGRALGFGQVNLADKAVINLNVLPADAVLVIAALMHDDFLNHLPQEGGGQFLKGKVLSDDTHKLFRIDGGGLPAKRRRGLSVPAVPAHSLPTVP